MKHIPNTLSFARIPLSLLLIYIATLQRPVLFVCLYSVTALTDMLDGLLARKFGWHSDFGAKLDGFADIVLVLSMLVIVFFVLKLRFAPYVIAFVAAIALVKAVNLLFTRIKFKQWSTMHSFLVRYTAIPIYLIAPVFVWTGRVLNELVIIILIAILVSVLEETWILAVLKEYDMNTKSVWHAKRTPTAASLAMNRQ